MLKAPGEHRADNQRTVAIEIDQQQLALAADANDLSAGDVLGEFTVGKIADYQRFPLGGMYDLPSDDARLQVLHDYLQVGRFRHLLLQWKGFACPARPDPSPTSHAGWLQDARLNVIPRDERTEMGWKAMKTRRGAGYSRKSLRTLLRVGCLSFLRAFASICRMRSLVTPNSCPTSSSVRLLPSSRP